MAISPVEYDLGFAAPVPHDLQGQLLGIRMNSNQLESRLRQHLERPLIKAADTLNGLRDTLVSFGQMTLDNAEQFTKQLQDTQFGDLATRLGTILEQSAPFVRDMDRVESALVTSPGSPAQVMERPAPLARAVPPRQQRRQPTVTRLTRAGTVAFPPPPANLPCTINSEMAQSIQAAVSAGSRLTWFVSPTTVLASTLWELDTARRTPLIPASLVPGCWGKLDAGGGFIIGMICSGTTPPPPTPIPPPPESGVCPAPCPPPDINIEVPPCPTPEEKEEESLKWNAWVIEDTRQCQVLPENQGPGPGNWELQGTYDTAAAARSAIASFCGLPIPESPIPPSGIYPGIFDWNNLAWCDTLTALLGTIPVPQNTIFAEMFGLRDKAGNPTTPALLQSLDLFGLPIGETIAEIGRTLVDGIDKTLIPGLDTIATFAGTGLGLPILATLSNLGYVLTAGATKQLSVATQQSLDYYIASTLPDVSSVNLAYLSNQISETTWRCWVRANGFADVPMSFVVQSQRSKLTPGQLTQLLLRGVIDHAEYSNRIRELGYLTQNEPQWFRRLAEVLPTPTDLVRMMVRDADDMNLVSRFDLDADFPQKFAGQLSSWASMQGVDEQHMRYLWRSHWVIPSPTQLFEMYHRLRTIGTPPDQDPVWQDVETALRQQDILPFWIDRLRVISHLPLTRVDVRRAYNIGRLTDEDVRSAYRNEGYDDENIEILLDFARFSRIISYDGNRWVNLYLKGAINGQELETRLSRDGLPIEVAREVISRAKDRLGDHARSKCVQSIRRQHLTGGLSVDEVRDQLVAQGLDPDQAAALAASFQCERQAQGKTAGAATLCQWVEDGLIDAQEFFDRLVAVGYGATEARHIVESCGLRLSRRRQQRQMRAEKEAARLARMAEKGRRARLRAAERRHKLRAKAAESLSRGEGMSLSDALLRVDAAIQLLTSTAGATYDEAIESVVVCAEQTKRAPEIAFEQCALAIYTQRRAVGGDMLVSPAELAEEMSAMRLLQCSQCFWQLQVDIRQGDLPQHCPVCAGPLTVTEIAQQLGGSPPLS